MDLMKVRQMGIKHYKVEEIGHKLREAEVLIAKR